MNTSMYDSVMSFEWITFLEYGFVQRALVAGTFVGITCAMLGTFLVLRKMSLIGDGLSHVSFGAVALGLFLGVMPVYVAIPVVVIASLLMLKISEKTKVYGDAAIGIVSATGIASGVMFASLAGGFNVDLFGYLFGNILAISPTEAYIAVALSLIVLVSLSVFYWDFFSATFDEDYAKTTGVRTDLVDALLAVLTAVTVVLSVKVVGVMLVSALLILPAVTALQISRSMKGTIFFAGICSFFSVVIGIVGSFFFDLPAGATIVLLLVFSFVVVSWWKKIH